MGCTQSKEAVASSPQRAATLARPPSCCASRFDDAYTSPCKAIQQSVSLLCLCKKSWDPFVSVTYRSQKDKLLELLFAFQQP